MYKLQSSKALMIGHIKEVATAKMTPIQEALNALTAFVWTACTITQG